jgi:hypothetical protein
MHADVDRKRQFGGNDVRNASRNAFLSLPVTFGAPP